MNNYIFPKKNNLSEILVEKTKYMSEFRNGATQVTVVLYSGLIFKEVLLSNYSIIIAVRGFNKLPFAINEIADIYQNEEDINPKKTNQWTFF